MAQKQLIPGHLRDFIASEVVCCLAVRMPEGEVHAAPLLFWCDTDTLKIYMCTSKLSEKMWWWRDKLHDVDASIAVGLVPHLPYSLQMRGKLTQFNPQDDPDATHEYEKIASELDKIDDPNHVMVVFTPSWARYTDRYADYREHSIELG